MKLTKYQHACFTLEQDGQLLVVDPGTLSTDFSVPTEPVVAIVITHEHPDHFSLETITAILAAHPEALVYAPAELTAQLPDTFNLHAAAAGVNVTVGPFRLEFTGGEHAIIHPDTPMCANVGVLINDSVYYPGDSFVHPPKHADPLLLPIAAPWMKTAESMDYLSALSPQLAVPTHDAVLSDAGKLIFDNWINKAAESVGCAYRRIDGQSIVLE